MEGARLLGEFCEKHGIRYERPGEVIVAATEAELRRLDTLYERGTANGVPGLAVIGREPPDAVPGRPETLLLTGVCGSISMARR